jgi:hypothetical protein
LRSGECWSCLKNSGLSIIAAPELQNFDRGPNGTGQDVWDLAQRFSWLRVNVKSLVPRDWNLKTEGRWSEKEWRLHHMKGFLQGLWVGAGAGTKKVENVVVSHSSFFRELLTEGEIYLEPISVKLRYAN